MTDFNQPINTTLVTNVLGIIRDRDSSIAKMDFTGDTNLVAGFLRYNRTNRVFEEWSGSAWVEMRVEQPGIVKPFAGTTAPRGHLLCDGAAVNRTTYAALFAIIGTTYGSGDGSTTFNLPNMTGRFPLGKAAAGTGSTLAGTGGSLDHLHSVPAHYHGKGTLNITSSGGHTTTINFSHGHDNSSAGGNTTGIKAADGGTDHVTGFTALSLTDGGHGHTIEGHGTTTAGDGKNTGNAGNKFAKARQTGTTGTGDTNGSTSGSGSNITLNNANHRHSVSLVDPGHGHSVTVTPLTGNRDDATLNGGIANTDRGKHTHGSADFSGSVGNTGGSNGDAAFNSGTANPPFLVLNYIISF